MGARARTGGRPRRLRLPGHEDPREDDARRPARGRTSCGATSTSAPATTTRRTARVYEDVGLFTADPDIAADVADLFNFVTGFGRPQRFRKLLVAPFNLRKRLIEQIREVAAAAAAGKPARIRIKCNSLTHPEVIEELYRASQAGAEIDVIVRAIVHARSRRRGPQRAHPRPVDPRPLPRAQPPLLLRGRRERTYLLGSADLMPRNLEHRIEVVVPDRGHTRTRTRSSRSSRRSSPTTRRPGSCRPTGRGTGLHRRSASGDVRPRPSSCDAGNGRGRLARAH